MSEQAPQDKDQDRESVAELLKLMDPEQLLRLHKCLKAVGRKYFMRALAFEIKSRQAIERAGKGGENDPKKEPEGT